MSGTYHRTTCSHDCPSVCLLEVERLDARTIGRVRGSKANSYTAGVTCAKMARYAERVHHPDRLTTPLRRTGEKGAAAFAEISWEDALGEVAEGFTRAAQAGGAETVWPVHSGGNMGQVQRYGVERLRHVMGYSRELPSICITPSMAGWRAGVGLGIGADPREMAEADLIIAWGTNLVSTQVNAMSHVARARKQRGAKLAVVDIYANPTVEAADIALIIRPGTDGALAAAIMHVLLDEGLADRGYLAALTDFDDRIEAHLASKTPAWAAAVTGLTADEIIRFARLYGETEKSFLRMGIGFSRSHNGAANLHAVSCLPAMTGAWRHTGGGAFFVGSGFWKLDTSLIQGLDALDDTIRVLAQPSIGPILTGDTDALKGGPPVGALFLQNFNCAVTAPDSASVGRGLARTDLFTCVHEQFMTPTARMADIVLPATSFMEHDDIYIGFGHTHLGLGPKVIEPVGEARSNHDVVNGLAEKLGASHAGFAMSAWEMIDALLTQSGLPGVETVKETGWIDGALPFDEAHFINAFPNPTGRFRFRPDWPSIGPDPEGMPPLPDHAPLINAADQTHPFRLVTPPARSFLNSSFTETPTSRAREGAPRLLVHPEDAKRLGLGEGAGAQIGNAQGLLNLPARLFSGLQPGVLVLEGVWPNDDFAGGLGVNLLTDARPVAPSGGAAFHDQAVWLRPA